MKISVAVIGATGSVGRAVVAAISASQEFELVAAVSRKAAGQDVGSTLQVPIQGMRMLPSIEAALETKPRVLIDYTHVSVVYQHCAAAISNSVNVVIGTSGLIKEQFSELGALADKHKVGVFAAGNFSVTAALLQHLAKVAAQHLPHWEIIDYGKPKYVHAPSSTGRELADTLAQVRPPLPVVPPEETFGLKEARGATVSGAQIHSIRSPGFGFSIEAIFGLPSERLVLRHDCSESPLPYVHGTLLAAKAVTTFTGLRRGIDKLLFNESCGR